MLARVEDSVVTDVIDEMMQHHEVDASGTVKAIEMLPTDPVAFFGAGADLIKAPDDVCPGWIYDGKNFKPPEPNLAHAAATARIMRDQMLSSTDWLIDRHRDQIEQGHPTSLTADQYKSLLAYRQALRDLPKSAGFPLNIQWPTAPF